MPSAGPKVKKLRSLSPLSVSCPGDSLNVNLRGSKGSSVCGLHRSLEKDLCRVIMCSGQ